MLEFLRLQPIIDSIKITLFAVGRNKQSISGRFFIPVDHIAQVADQLFKVYLFAGLASTRVGALVGILLGLSRSVLELVREKRIDALNHLSQRDSLGLLHGISIEPFYYTGEYAYFDDPPVAIVFDRRVPFSKTIIVS